MGTYISENDVKLRLAGKIRFTDTPDTEPNKMPNALLKRLVLEAEAQVEYDLSPRYMSPLQTDEGAAFKNLPARPTQDYVKTLCELQSVMRVLETDFGSGTVADAEKYSKNIEKRYDKMVAQLMKRRDDSYNNWFYPPLPSLRLNHHNTEADDGYSGQILVTSQGRGDFPSAQINSPGENFFSGSIDQLDQDS